MALWDPAKLQVLSSVEQLSPFEFSDEFGQSFWAACIEAVLSQFISTRLQQTGSLRPAATSVGGEICHTLAKNPDHMLARTRRIQGLCRKPRSLS